VRRTKAVLRAIIATYGLWPIFFPVASSAQSPAQPQFRSGGIQVVVNRAVGPSTGSLLALSLIMTNLGDEEVLVARGERLPMIITDTGGSAEVDAVTGIPPSNCGDAVAYCIQTFGFSPAVIDRNNSIVATLAFRMRGGGRVCSVDFSMPLFIQRGGGTAPWRQITVGLPNIKVC
jgi:hypothetical protein